MQHIVWHGSSRVCKCNFEISLQPDHIDPGFGSPTSVMTNLVVVVVIMVMMMVCACVCVCVCVCVCARVYVCMYVIDDVTHTRAHTDTILLSLHMCEAHF